MQQPEIDRLADVVTRAIEMTTMPLLSRIVSLERQIKAIEQRAVIPGPPGPPGPAGERGIDGVAGRDGLPGRDGEKGLNGKDGAPGPAGVDGTDGRPGADGKPGVDGRDGRDGLPGPTGEKGHDGTNGIDGRPGVDGKDGAPGRDGTLDDAEFVQGEDVRSVTVRSKSTGRTLGLLHFPAPIYRGVYESGKTYAACDWVTHQGSVWHAMKETSDIPGEGATAWVLCAKRGRDGKPGKDGGPGPEGKPGRDLTQMDFNGKKW